MSILDSSGIAIAAYPWQHEDDYSESKPTMCPIELCGFRDGDGNVLLSYEPEDAGKIAKALDWKFNPITGERL